MLDHTDMVEDRQTDAFYVKRQNLFLWNPGALLFIGNRKHEPSPSQRQVSNKQRLNIGSHRCPWFSLRTKGRKLNINSQRNSSTRQGSEMENCSVRVRHEYAGVNTPQKEEETLVEPHSPFVGLAPQQLFIYFNVWVFESPAEKRLSFSGGNNSGLSWVHTFNRSEQPIPFDNFLGTLQRSSVWGASQNATASSPLRWRGAGKELMQASAAGHQLKQSPPHC